MRLIFLLAAAAILFKCTPKPVEKKTAADTTLTFYEEMYRPSYHFSPEKNWMNDPNGLVYSNGEYHLFYQYNPYGDIWGHMSWGHAVSSDLLRWKHLPVAIEEYIDKAGDSTMIFSGSAVIDVNNTSGFFPNDSAGMVAIYTSHIHNDAIQKQHQSIAYSKDNGRTFTRFEKNPVLDINLKDFRDPKVFWFSPEKKWIMTVVIPDQFKAQFYESRDLKEWKFLSELGPLGDTVKIWECPDLIQLPILGEKNKKKWALLISNAHPEGEPFVGMQYFIGNFDGKKFTAERPAQYPLYLEYGKDFYAGVTFNNIASADGRTIVLGWANNWAYGQHIPTSPWRSSMALPRELYIAHTPEGDRIIQRPVREVVALRQEELPDISMITNTNAVEIEAELIAGTAQRFGIKLFKSEKEETVIGYDQAKQQVFFDRTKSGNVSFHPDFPSTETAPVKLKDGRLKLHIFVDHSIVEVFINDGEQVITSQVFPTGKDSKIEVFKEDGEAQFNIKAWSLQSVWSNH
jgi:fructan beta-fructosidase